MTWLVRRALPLALFAAIAALLVRHASPTLSNPDTYFHLRFGEEFLTDWSLREPGSVSTFATADWLPTQWLAQVVMAKVEDWFGLAGVAWLFGLHLLLLATVLYVTTRRAADPLVSVVCLIVALLACMPGLSMRPQLLSFTAMAILVASWIRAARRHRPPWLAIPLTWLWAMCHGMWPLGIVLSTIAVIGLALDGTIRGREIARWALVPLVSAAAAALTPVGPQLYAAVLTVNSRSEYFAEWQPVRFTSPHALALLALAAPLLVVMLRRRNSWFEVLVVGLGLGLALYSARTLPMAAVVLVPFAAAAFQSLIGERSAVRRAEPLTIGAIVIAGLGTLALVTPRTADDPPVEPAWVEPSLSALPPGTKLLNDWGQGGYVMWRFPRLDPLMHGYGDTFTTAELERNADILAVVPGWDEQVRETGAEVALVNRESALAYALVHQSGWRVVHSAEAIQLLRAPDGWLAEQATIDEAR